MSKQEQRARQESLLRSVVRETRLSAGIAGELARIAQESPEGLPATGVRKSLQYLRMHLTEANAAAIALEEVAKGCELPKEGH
jgi:hypothetical protein